MAKLEYIWLDGTYPTQQLRSKTRIERDVNFTPKPENCSLWSFDGSSTNQAYGSDSDCVLKPVYVCKDPIRKKNSYLVLCEVMCPDGSPHQSNTRASIDQDDEQYWFGFEQEYFLVDPKTRLPLGFTPDYTPPPQGPYYCGIGAGKSFGRKIIEEHLELCLEAGIGIEGINAEVAPGQWEFQVFGKGCKRVSDELWIARYLLERCAEEHDVAIDFHPKPLGEHKDWNGSGMHCNFSNNKMRTCGDKTVFEQICGVLRNTHAEHMQIYGAFNNLRLSGKHETASADVCTWGLSDRGASIRIPIATKDAGWKGRLEDRRPASNADPYLITEAIKKSLTSSEHST